MPILIVTSATKKEDALNEASLLSRKLPGNFIVYQDLKTKTYNIIIQQIFIEQHISTFRNYEDKTLAEIAATLPGLKVLSIHREEFPHCAHDATLLKTNWRTILYFQCSANAEELAKYVYEKLRGHQNFLLNGFNWYANIFIKNYFEIHISDIAAINEDEMIILYQKINQIINNSDIKLLKICAHTTGDGLSQNLLKKDGIVSRGVHPGTETPLYIDQSKNKELLRAWQGAINLAEAQFTLSVPVVCDFVSEGELKKLQIQNEDELTDDENEESMFEATNAFVVEQDLTPFIVTWSVPKRSLIAAGRKIGLREFSYNDKEFLQNLNDYLKQKNFETFLNIEDDPCYLRVQLKTKRPNLRQRNFFTESKSLNEEEVLSNAIQRYVLK